LAPRPVEAACGRSQERPTVALEYLKITPERDAGHALEHAWPRPDSEPGTPGPCPGGVCAPGRPAPLSPTAPSATTLEQWPELVALAQPARARQSVLISHHRPLHHERP